MNKTTMMRAAVSVGDKVKVFLHGNPTAVVVKAGEGLTVRFEDGSTMDIPRTAVLAVNGASVR